MRKQVWSSMREATNGGCADDVVGMYITRLGTMPAAEAAAWRAVLDRRRREPMGALPELVVADVEPEPLSRCAALHILVKAPPCGRVVSVCRLLWILPVLDTLTHPLWCPLQAATQWDAVLCDVVGPHAHVSVPLHRLTSAGAATNHQHLVVERTACSTPTVEGGDSRDSSCGSARVVWPPLHETRSAVLPGEADTQRVFCVAVIARSSPAQPADVATTWSSAPPPELSEHRAGRQLANFPDQDAPCKSRLPVLGPSDGDIVSSTVVQIAQTATALTEGGLQAAAAAVSLAGPSAADVVLTEQTEPSRPTQQPLAPAAWSESSPVQRPEQPPALTGTPAVAAPASARLLEPSSPQRHRSPASEAAQPAMHAAEADFPEGTSSAQPPEQDPAASAMQDSCARPSSSTSDAARPVETQLGSPAAEQGLRLAPSDSTYLGDSIVVQASSSRI